MLVGDRSRRKCAISGLYRRAATGQIGGCWNIYANDGEMLAAKDTGASESPAQAVLGSGKILLKLKGIPE